MFSCAFIYRTLSLSNWLSVLFSFRSNKTITEEREAKRISDVRNFQVLEKHDGQSVGIECQNIRAPLVGHT
jgi:lysozyme